MNLKQLFSLKNQAQFCFLSSVAVLLSMPSYGFEIAHIILSIISIISFFSIKESIVIKALCLSVFLNSAYLILYGVSGIYYNWIINAIILIILVVGPIIYAIIKTDNGITKVFLGIIALTTLPRLWLGYCYSFDTNTLYNLSFYLLLLSFVLLFLSSAVDTTDKATRYISIGSAIASAFILFVAITGIIYELCEQPKSDGLFNYISEYDYTPEEYPVYAACRQIFSFSTKWLFLAGVIMASYFAYLLKRSKMSLSGVCIPAILSMLGFGVIYGANTLFAHYRGFGLWNEADDVVLLYFAEYIVLTYSLYKFYKKF